MRLVQRVHEHSLNEASVERSAADPDSPVSLPLSAEPTDVRHRGIARLAGFALLFRLAVVASLGLEVMYSRAAGQPSSRLFLEGLPPGVLLLNSVLLFSLALAWYSLTNSFFASGLGVGVVSVLAAFANTEKLRLRGEPLYPSDSAYLGELDFLVESIGTTSTVLFASLAMCAIVVIVAWRFLRRKLPTIPGWNSSAVSNAGWRSRVFSAVVGFSSLIMSAYFTSPGSLMNQVYEHAGAEWITWSQNENYRHNGFTASWLFNLPGEAMRAPSDYSEARVAEVVERYQRVAEEHNRGRNDLALESMNIIVVLSESFADPLSWEGITPDEDPIPFTRELMREHTSGTMLSSGYGGGTANVEFEVFTGLSVRELEPQMRTPYQSHLPFQDSFPSLLSAYASAGSGRATDAGLIGIHPFWSSFYQRSRVYPVLGFDRAHFLEDFIDEGRTAHIENDRYASDASAFDWALDEIEESEDAVVLSILTMQNHGPHSDKYSDPISISEQWEGSSEVEQYLRGLAHSDEALKRFVDALEESGEPTALLLYGDHLPAIFPDGVLGGDADLAPYTTPYVIWTNTVSHDASHEGRLGPNHLLTQVRETLRAPLTTMDALLLELRRHLPAASPAFLLDQSGNTMDPDSLSSSARAVLDDYRAIQYHLVGGSGEWADQVYSVPSAPEAP